VVADRSAQIARYNARRTLLEHRFPSARFRFEQTGRHARAYLYALPFDRVPLAAGVAAGRGADALREAADRAMLAAGLRA